MDRGDRRHRTFKLTLQYDGTEYVGWQRQTNGTSIQGLLEDALQRIEGSRVTVHGAGRTDAGVHARGQVASARLTRAVDPARLARALNAVLPPDIRIAAAELADDGFHARFSARGKTYAYQVINAPFVPPFLRRYTWHVMPPLNLEAMREASSALIGEHDFAAFQGTRSAVHTTIRTVRRLEWLPGGGAEEPLVMRIEGDGFLRHMVRTMAGTLVEIGLGRRHPREIDAILASRDRVRAGMTAPARGLVLLDVLYSPKIET